MSRLRIKLVLYFLPILSLISCDKDPVKKQDPYNIQYEQYGDPFQEVPEIEDVIMYEVNLRAFSSAGDLQGVIDRIDSIAEFGVNVLWLMPIYPIGIEKGINSPYCVRDYKAVSEEYGTLDDLRDLTDAAHARGMAVILDWVANHTSWDNPWIQTPTWYTQDAKGNIIHPPGTNWLDVADLNYDNTIMRSAMIDAMRFWIFRANIDGFRCDYADGVPFDFWEQAWDKVHVIPGRKFILFAEGARTDHFEAGFDLNFGWEFYGSIKDIFNGQPAGESFQADENEYKNIPANKHWVRFTTNHDESAWDATPVNLFNGIDGALAASVLTIFTGGVPLIYGGQEVGTLANVPFFNNSITEWDNNPEMKAAYKKILNFYRQSAVAKNGTNVLFGNSDVECFKKVLDEDELLIIVNIRNSNLIFTLPEELQNTEWTNVMTNEQLNLADQLSLEPYSFYILD